jgi:tetratricopeptide (TPR) repeat protein
MFTMKFFRFFLLIVMIMGNTVVIAQTKKTTAPPPPTKEQAAELKKEASAKFKDGNFRGALEPYKKLIAYDPEDMDFNYKLGMCYLYSNVDKTQAVQYFVKAVDKKDCPKDAYYQMGRALLISGLFDEAIDAFDKYKSVNKGAVNPKFFLDQNMEYCYNAKEYVKNPVDVKLRNLGKMVNTPFPDYAPVSMAVDTAVFFTSNRKGNAGGIIDGNGDLIPDIYVSTRVDTTWTKAKNMGIGVNSELYDISTGMTSNGDVMVIYKETGEAYGDIYISRLAGKSWQKAELLDPSLETKTLETGACLSPDGKKLFFAANMKGTLGGKDIFMMEMDSSKKWKAPVNLGPEVNTKFDEENPFIWHDGKTLFFASQGHTSMGGFDIFMTSQGDPSQPWSKPSNIGYPLNTFDDDLYFTLAANAKTGFISSLRKGGFGELDIYHFTLKDPLVAGAGILFRASFIASTGLPAKETMCSIVKESTGQVLGVMTASGPNAEIFILLPPGTYTLKARSAKLGRLEQEISISGSEGDKGVSKTYKLQPPPPSKL